MKLKADHITMLGVGISAVSAIAMILYYRHQAASGAANSVSGMGAFPYFQTAALPSSVGGGSTIATAPPATAAKTAPTLDPSIGQTSIATQLPSFLQSLVSQQSAQLSKAGGFNTQPTVTRGYVNSTPTGLNFAIGTLTPGADPNWSLPGEPLNSTNSTVKPTLTH